MDKREVVNILEQIGTLLELQGENPFKARAYHAAARTIDQLEINLADAVSKGTLAQIPGIGEALREKITTLVTTDQLPYYDELRSKSPPGLLQMLRIPGLGPKKARALFETLKIDDLEKLKAACDGGEVAKLPGFGARTQAKILEGLSFLSEVGERVLLDQAWPLAMEILDELRQCPGVIRSEVCGSIRRRKDIIKDIDILISSDTPAPIMQRFVSLPGVVQVLGHGPTKSSVIITGQQTKTRLNADLRVVSDEQFPFALHYFTGSKEHNIAIRARAQAYDLKLNEYELVGPKRRVACTSEADIFRALDLDDIPPEMREHTGEIEAAAEHRLPELVKFDDLRGTFHCHTTYSDGSASLEQMVEAARAQGLQYLGIADHSQSLTIAHGLTPERVQQQQAEIDDLQKRLKGFRIFKGTECDILADGSLDYSDEVLATFDYVVASVHTHFGQSEAEMTARIVRALGNPFVTMLGHSTGRLLLRRDGYKVDLEAVLQAAAKHRTMIEINANPLRLDLDWIHCKRAHALGVQLVINPDAHSTEDMAYLKDGINVARRGWLEKKDIFNTQTAAQVSKALAARKSPGSGRKR